MGAAIVPLPAFPSEQVREFIRASKAENNPTGLPERLAGILRMV
jgi:hypothetical protein